MNIRDLKDKHKGTIGFVVGSGPSVRHIDPELLKDHTVLSVNSSIKKFKDCDYYVCDDWDVMNWDYFDLARSLGCIKLLYRNNFHRHEKLFRTNNYIYYSHKEYAVNGVIKPNNLKLTKSEPIIGARTVSASAIHLAYIMGCDPIVLLGSDCKYEDGKRYFWQFPGESMCYRKDGKKYNFATNKEQKDFNCVSFEEYWQHFVKVNPDNNVILIKNTSTLDMFKKLNLEEILNEKKKT